MTIALRAGEIARVLENRFQFDYGEDVMKRVLGLPWMAANHLNLNYGRAINTGYAAVLEQIKTYLKNQRMIRKTGVLYSLQNRYRGSDTIHEKIC